MGLSGSSPKRVRTSGRPLGIFVSTRFVLMARPAPFLLVSEFCCLIYGSHASFSPSSNRILRARADPDSDQLGSSLASGPASAGWSSGRPVLGVRLPGEGRSWCPPFHQHWKDLYAGWRRLSSPVLFPSLPRPRPHGEPCKGEGGRPGGAAPTTARTMKGRPPGARTPGRQPRLPRRC